MARSRAVPHATVVLDCTDNFATRHSINRACVAHRVPLVSGAALRFDGQISTFDFRDDASPCYACIFPQDQAFEEVACSTMGVFAPLVGIIGALQAAEALKLIGAVGKTLTGRLQEVRRFTRRMEYQTMRVVAKRIAWYVGTGIRFELRHTGPTSAAHVRLFSFEATPLHRAQTSITSFSAA